MGTLTVLSPTLVNLFNYRTMQLLWESQRGKGKTPPECVQRLLAVLRRWHGNDTAFILKVMTSNGACRRQDLHRDCVKAYKEHKERIRQGKRTKLLLTDYSMVVATEDSTSPSKIISSDDNEVVIRQGHAAIWSCEYIHTDASYSVPNRRLFISITSIHTSH